MSNQYNLWFKCNNKSCESKGEEFGPIHSDTFVLGETSNGLPYKVLDEKGKLTDKHGYFVLQSICPKCKVQMEENREEKTDEIVNPTLHKDITHCTQDIKKSPAYYTRWNKSIGGKPEFNPVSGTGSPNGKKTLN